MSSSKQIKTSKIGYTTLGIILGSMIGGATIATAGWWYSDRLDMMFGNPIDINETTTTSGDCKEGQVGTNTYIDENGVEKVQTVKCSNDGSNIQRLKAVKKKSGISFEVLTKEMTVKSSGRIKGDFEPTFTVPVSLKGSGPRWTVVAEKNTTKPVKSNSAKIKQQ